jgi:CheY-like chemotaxis protein
MASVLFVEDEFDSAEPIAAYLRRKGHRVDCQPNGRDAIVALTAQSPDVVLLDLRMPVMDGVDFLRVLRSYLSWHDLPVILLTAVSRGAELERARELSVRNVFIKANFQLSELADAISDAAGSASHAS